MLLDLSLALALAGPSPSLDWTAPAGCPGREQILEQAQRLMGTSSPEAAFQDVSVTATIEPAPTGFTVAIDVQTPSGVTRKTASADDCVVLGSVAALMIAVAVDPVQAVATLAIEPVPPAEEPAAPDDPPPIPPLTEPTPAAPERLPPEALTSTPPTSSPRRSPLTSPRRSSSLRALLRASGSVGAGIVPSLDGRVSLGAGLLAPVVRAELLAFHVFAQPARYPELPEVGATVAAWGGAARVGPRFALATLELHALAGLSFAALTAAGFGVARPSEDASAWVALDLTPGLRWVPTSRFALGVDLEGLVAIRRPAFVLDALPVLYRAGRVGIHGAVVFEFRPGFASRLTNRRSPGDSS